MRPLTWDELANLYKARTGQSARVRPMEEIAKWALAQQDITTDGEDNICLSTPKRDTSQRTSKTGPESGKESTNALPSGEK